MTEQDAPTLRTCVEKSYRGVEWASSGICARAERTTACPTLPGPRRHHARSNLSTGTDTNLDPLHDLPLESGTKFTNRGIRAGGIDIAVFIVHLLQVHLATLRRRIDDQSRCADGRCADGWDAAHPGGARGRHGQDARHEGDGRRRQ